MPTTSYDQTERIAKSLERIAEALERAVPPMVVVDPTRVNISDLVNRRPEGVAIVRHHDRDAPPVFAVGGIPTCGDCGAFTGLAHSPGCQNVIPGKPIFRHEDYVREQEEAKGKTGSAAHPESP